MSNNIVTDPSDAADQPIAGLSAVADDHDAVVAMVVAMAARNGVEDLHAAGLFGDAQAPAFNRRVRGRIYEALLAQRQVAAGGDIAFTDYQLQLLEDTGWAPDQLDEAVGADVLVAAVQLAVRDFAASEGLDPEDAVTLEATAATAARRYAIDHLTTPSDKSEAQLAYLAGMIPRYWEPPTVSNGFAELLDHDGR